jgi:hypothetical protein
MSAIKGRGAAGYVVNLADRRSIVAVAVAVGSVAGVVAVVVHLWREVGDVQISAAGWVALALGVLVTLALGIGLRALVFISGRRGYDEPAAIRVEPNKPPLDHPRPGPRRLDRSEGAVSADPSP